MLRKFAVGLVAAGALAIAAFVPTSASAYQDGPQFRGQSGFGMHRGWHGARAQYRHHGCIQQRMVRTPWGFRYRSVNVCR